MRLKETEIGEAVVDWLKGGGYEVYQEVQVFQFGAVADIVAVRQGWITWIIECKTSFSLDVMIQASDWRLSHYRSVAVPYSTRRDRRRVIAEKMCKNYFGVGVLSFDGWGIRINEAAPLKREYHRNSKEILLPSLKEEHKTFAKAGNSNGSYLTPYKMTMKRVRQFLENKPRATIREIIEAVDFHYSNQKSAIQNIRNSLDLYEDWCSVDKSEIPYKYFVKD